MRISMLDVRSLRVFVYQLNSVFFRRWQGDLARKSLDQDREITGAIRSAETKLLREMDDIKREMQEMWEGDEWVSAFAQEMEFRLAQAVEEANVPESTPQIFSSIKSCNTSVPGVSTIQAIPFG